MEKEAYMGLGDHIGNVLLRKITFLKIKIKHLDGKQCLN